MAEGREYEAPDSVKRAIVFVVGALFTLVALLVFAGNLASPLWQWGRTKFWVETPCIVLSSEGKAQRMGRTTRRLIVIRYAYTWNYGKYVSDRYSPFHFFSGASAQKAVVASHAPERETTCFVNPRDPFEAVLNRNFDPSCLLVLLVLPFAGFGMFMMVVAVKGI